MWAYATVAHMPHNKERPVNKDRILLAINAAMLLVSIASLIVEVLVLVH